MGNGSLFKQAVKQEAKLRLAIAGPSGSGKTYTSLAVALALAGEGGRVALADTEHGSAKKYADLFAFDVLEMEPPFHPDRFGEAIRAASEGGYNVIILDSLTHAWSGTGGLLEIVDEIAKRQSKGGPPNTFSAWKDATPIQNRLIDAIVTAPIHLIATIRSKQDYVQEKDEKGKTSIRKVGMAPQQRDGFEYEFDVFGEMTIDNELIISKTRCPALAGRVLTKPGADLAATLAKWLTGAHAPTNGSSPAQQSATREPTTQATATTTTPPHWTKIDAEVNKFYEWASTKGLSAKDCKRVLGVKDIGDYHGSKVNAWQMIDATAKPAGEAP